MDRALDKVGVAATNLREHPWLWGAFGEKALSKVSHLRRRRSGRLAADWCADVAMDLAAFIDGHDASLAAETGEVQAELLERLPEAMTRAGFSPTCRANVGLLYFLVRWKRPAVVVETGVAAGASSWAILRAMDANGEGHLHSSDLPYLFMEGAAERVGAVVPEALRRRWTLHLGTDRANLAKIAAESGRVGLLHYDSDKSFHGRRLALSALDPVLDPGAVLVFDDIEDNGHFMDLVRGLPRNRWWVFAEPTKYVGLVLP